MTVDLHTIETTAMWALVAIAVIGIVAAILIKKIIGKVISLVLAAVLVFFGWQQRAHVMDAANEAKGQACAAADHLPTSFFGVTVKLPDSWCK